MKAVSVCVSVCVCVGGGDCLVQVCYSTGGLPSVKAECVCVCVCGGGGGGIAWYKCAIPQGVFLL